MGPNRRQQARAAKIKLPTALLVKGTTEISVYSPVMLMETRLVARLEADQLKLRIPLSLTLLKV